MLQPGFCTASRVTQAAGRGVGMDVVANEVKQLGGSLRFRRSAGRARIFTMRLPFTLAITQALLVRAGDELYAIPLPSVEGVARIPRAELSTLMSQPEPSFQYGGQDYDSTHLGMYCSAVPRPACPRDGRTHIRASWCAPATTRARCVTDEMLGSREIVVKSVGPQIAGIRGISGATILGDGRIVLILDINALVRTGARA